MNTLPKQLFKYLPIDRGMQVLDALRIRFSQASVLNDVLELRPPIVGIGSHQDVLEAVLQRFELHHPGKLAVYRGTIPDGSLDEVLGNAVSTILQNGETTIAKWYSELDRNYGILSLTEVPTSTLMWSHYADGARGCVIEFAPEHSFFNGKLTNDDSFRHLRKIRYAASRLPKFLLQCDEDEALYTKSIEWSYEQEWRIIRNFNQAVQNGGVDAYGKDVLLFDLPSDSIKSIVFGLRTSQNDVLLVKELVSRKADLYHLCFKKIQLVSNGGLEVVIDT